MECTLPIKQLSFLEQDKPEITLNIKVRSFGNGVWEATINNGWWIGTGKNKKEAIKKVVKSFLNGA